MAFTWGHSNQSEEIGIALFLCQLILSPGDLAQEKSHILAASLQTLVSISRRPSTHLIPPFSKCDFEPWPREPGGLSKRWYIPIAKEDILFNHEMNIDTLSVSDIVWWHKKGAYLEDHNPTILSIACLLTQVHFLNLLISLRENGKTCLLAFLLFCLPPQPLHH